MKNYEAAIKDLEHIQQVEPKNKRVKKDLLSLRSSYKVHSDTLENKKFKKMQINEEENSSKVQEIFDTPKVADEKIDSGDPVIADENEDKQKENIQPQSVNIPNGNIEPVESNTKEAPIISEYVKLDIGEDSSDDEDEQTKQTQAEVKVEKEEKEEKVEKVKEETKENKNITAFDKNLMMHEKVNEELFNDLEEEKVQPKPKVKSEPKIETKAQPESTQSTEETHSKIEEIDDDDIVEASPEEKAEIKLLEEIESNLGTYKEQAKVEHKKGMFDNAVQIYGKALGYISTKEHLFKHRISDLVVKR
jgi:hypothetical protein